AVAAGCTVRPMLATNTGVGEQNAPALLSSITVAPVGTRSAQEVRNHLIFLLHGGATEPANPRYRLDLAVYSVSHSAAQVQIGSAHEPTAGVITVTANYNLVDIANGSVVAS